MAVLVELPPELVLHTVAFLTRETIIDPEEHLKEEYREPQQPELVPDLPSINSLSQTNTVFHNIVDQALYDLCASVKPLGSLALFYAVAHELENTFDKLVALGISLDDDYYFPYSAAHSLLQIAAGRPGSLIMVRKLLKLYGEEMAARVHRRKNGVTALDTATMLGHLEIVRLLAPIRMPSTSDTFQKRYLSLALQKSAMTGQLEITKYLVSEGADVDFLDTLAACDYAPLTFAAGQNITLVQFLLGAGASPNLRSCHDRVALFTAADVDIAQTLLSAGADIHAVDATSRNVFGYIDDTELLRFYLEHGVDPTHEDQGGESALHYVCQESRFGQDAVELLLQFGVATIEKANGLEQTPVDIAMSAGRPEMVEILKPLVQDPDLKARIAAWEETEGDLEKVG
ncbi:ankyrin repeat-containing domain protein [Mycena galopus ATCC 62051]|nr:ankyrin repeat-containing domain protein [Mycena galopus ATCC 62051]